MLKFLLILVVALIAAVLLLYYLYPEKIFAFARRSLRRRGSLVQKSIMVEGRSWPYLEGGNFSKPVLILIHGFSGEKDNWAMLAPELKEHFHLIAPDLPGFGENERRSDIGFDNESQTRRFHAFVTALGLKRPHLAGNSMGGWIALRYAMDYPDELASLILIDSAGVTGTQESELQQLAADETFNPLRVRDLDDGARFMALVAHKAPRVPSGMRQAVYGDAIRHQVQLDDIFWVMAREMRDAPINHRLHEVRAPTLILWGQHDRLIHVSSVPVLQAGISNSDAVIFEDLGHVPMIEDPKTTAEAILEFMRSQ